MRVGLVFRASGALYSKFTVTRIIQCDNLKTGVQKHGKDEVVLNKSYEKDLIAVAERLNKIMEDIDNVSEES